MLAGAFVLATLGIPTVPPASAAAGQPLASRLLSISQMPAGWSVDTSPSSGVGCLVRILEPTGIKQTGSAGVEFEHDGTVPAVVEKLATFSNAKIAYQRIVANLAGCKRLNGTTRGVKVIGTVGEMSFPSYGDASEAFAARFTLEGTSVGEDILIVRDGSIVMGIDEGALAPVDTRQFQGFVVKALAKLG